jgi:hypothetical protein
MDFDLSSASVHGNILKMETNDEQQHSRNQIETGFQTQTICHASTQH